MNHDSQSNVRAIPHGKIVAAYGDRYPALSLLLCSWPLIRCVCRQCPKLVEQVADDDIEVRMSRVVRSAPPPFNNVRCRCASMPSGYCAPSSTTPTCSRAAWRLE